MIYLPSLYSIVMSIIIIIIIALQWDVQFVVKHFLSWVNEYSGTGAVAVPVIYCNNSNLRSCILYR